MGEGSSTTVAMDEVSKTCARCHLLKVRCGHTFPCDRCFRLCLPCRPRARGTRRKKEEGEASPAALNLPIIDYLFQTMDASALAKEFISAFKKVHAEGHIARERVLVALCHWQACSLVMGADVTRGIYTGLKAICKVTQAEIRKGLEAASLGRIAVKWADQSEQQRRVLLAAEVQKAQAISLSLQTTQAFSYMHTISPTTPLSMLIVDATSQRMSHAVNAPYEERFRTAGEMVHDLFSHKILNTLLFAALLAQSDRHAYFESVIHGLMVKNGPNNFAHFVKLFDRHGQIDLFLLKVRKFQAAEGYGFILHLHPCPPSRHISARPEFQQVSKRFRQIRGQAWKKEGRRAGRLKEEEAEEEEEGEEGEEEDTEEDMEEEMELSGANAGKAGRKGGKKESDVGSRIAYSWTVPSLLSPLSSYLCQTFAHSSNTFSSPSSASSLSSRSSSAAAAAAAAAASPSPSSLQVHPFATLPLTLPHFLPPEDMQQLFSCLDEGKMESLFHLSTGCSALPPSEPPLPQSSDDEEEEETEDEEAAPKAKGGRKKDGKKDNAEDDIKMHFPSLRRGGRKRPAPSSPSPTPSPLLSAPSSPRLPARAQSTFSFYPRAPESSVPPSSACARPSSSLHPSFPSPPFLFDSRHTQLLLDAGAGREGGGEATREGGRERGDSLGALDWPEPASEGAESNEGGRAGGWARGLPGGTENDLDFLIKIFAQEDKSNPPKEGGREGRRR